MLPLAWLQIANPYFYPSEVRDLSFFPGKKQNLLGFGRILTPQNHSSLENSDSADDDSEMSVIDSDRNNRAGPSGTLAAPP